MRNISFFLYWVSLIVFHPLVCWKTLKAWRRVIERMDRSNSPKSWIMGSRTKWALPEHDLEIADQFIRPIVQSSSQPNIQHALTLFELSPSGGQIRLKMQNSNQAESKSYAEVEFANRTITIGEPWIEADQVFEFQKEKTWRN